MRKRIIFLLLIVLLIQVSVFSLEKTNGRIKLVFHEKTGRFSVYFLNEADKNEYVPFLLDKDPRTTVLNVLVGNKVYTLGDSATFKQTLQDFEKETAFIWESNKLRVTESIAFLNSAESLLADGIKVTIYLENIGEDDLEVGIRYLFDTWLGEKKKLHFSTNAIENISRETEYSETVPLYWVSPSEGTNLKGLQMMTSGPGVTIPDRVVFGNWSRMNDSSWTFASKRTRNFNYLPYSINDSAVCHYYNPRLIRPGETHAIVLVFGNYTESGFALNASQMSSEVSDLYEQVVAVSPGDDRILSLRTDLKAVTDLIEKLDVLITGGEDMEEAELEIFKRVLDNLQKRKEQY